MKERLHQGLFGRLGAVLATALALSMTAACATTPREKTPDVEVFVRLGQDAAKEGERFWPDEDLAERFERYWTLRFAGLWREDFELEAPYFREMVEPNKYELYLHKARRKEPVKIELRRLEKVTEHLVAIGFYLELRGKGEPDRRIFMKDRWVMAGDRWFHVMRDPFFFGGGLGIRQGLGAL